MNLSMDGNYTDNLAFDPGKSMFGFSRTIVLNDNQSCIISRNRTTVFIGLYEGIPDTLILNVIAWVFLMLLFAVLRQQAWDYGRLALVNSSIDKKRWTQLFYAQNSEEVSMDEPSTPTISANDGEASERMTAQPGSSTTNGPDRPKLSRQSSLNTDRGFFSWIWITMRLTDEQIKQHSGPDALHYISFQRHLIAVTSIITFVCIVLILPINFHGNLSGDEHSFGHTTISNLDPASPLLWIHTLCAIAFVPLVVLVMRRSSGRYAGKVAPTRTIQVSNINPQDCNRTEIRNYMREVFPDLVIEDVQLAYNVTRLSVVAEDYDKVVAARSYCEIHKNRGTTIKVVPNCFSIKTIDALEYYRDREFRLRGEVARLKASAFNDPLGIAFITFTTTDAAQHVVHHFNPGTYRNWDIVFAPAASDIYWENLSTGNSQWYFKWVTVNVSLFLFLFFLTTPVLIVNIFNNWTFANDARKKISPLISEFLPTLLLASVAAVMPAIVAYSDKGMAHWTRSRQYYSIMTKSFGYLLFMILILPSLGLTSAQAFLDWTLHYGDQNYRWECIFLPDKGAFFVNYIITSAFIGTALELIRLPELIYYVFLLCMAKSQAETPYIRKMIVDVFPFGVHYAWMMLIFTTSVVYSVASPLIMPFALIYLMLKHFNDRHNLYFAYKYSNMISQGGGKIHSTAVTMAKYSVILLLTIMASLATIRSAKVDARAVVLIMSLVIIILLFIFMSPIKKCAMRPPRIIETDAEAPLYIPDILLNKRTEPMAQPSVTTYGTESGAIHLRIDGADMESQPMDNGNTNVTNNNNNIMATAEHMA